MMGVILGGTAGRGIQKVASCIGSQSYPNQSTTAPQVVKGKAVIVDVRPRSDFDRSHIQGSVSVPM